MQDAYITFEQPLNEYIRVCLRLEYLFQETMDNLNGHSLWECHLALAAILEAVNVIDRPDLKSKLTNALGQHARATAQFEEHTNVDKQKIREILTEIDYLTESLYQTHDKMGHTLRINPFLNTIRQQMTSPGGICGFNTPAYQLWLLQPAALRCKELTLWFKELEVLHRAVILLLHLTRNNKQPTSHIAQEGFYQQALDPNIPSHLVRIATPVRLQVYPEISVGKHRLSVRFYGLNTKERPVQSQEDIPFQLTCCIL